MLPSLFGTGPEKEKRKLLPPISISIPRPFIGLKEIAFE
jgi:hypothetical protein